MKILLTLLLSMVWGMFQAHAQRTATTSGGTATGAGGTATYTVGQPDYTTVSGTGGTATSGVQQPFEIVVVSGAKEAGIQLKIAVHPNPVQELVQLTVDAAGLQGTTYTLSDVAGKLLFTQSVNASATFISLKEYAAGTYFLSIKRDGKAVKTFKLIRK